jgi:hypothetical protein
VVQATCDAPSSSLINPTMNPRWKQRKDKEIRYTLELATLQGVKGHVGGSGMGTKTSDK